MLLPLTTGLVKPPVCVSPHSYIGSKTSLVHPEGDGAVPEMYDPAPRPGWSKQATGVPPELRSHGPDPLHWPHGAQLPAPKRWAFADMYPLKKPPPLVFQVLLNTYPVPLLNPRGP